LYVSNAHRAPRDFGLRADSRLALGALLRECLRSAVVHMPCLLGNKKPVRDRPVHATSHGIVPLDRKL
jgi:hypothetical protein